MSGKRTQRLSQLPLKGSTFLNMNKQQQLHKGEERLTSVAGKLNALRAAVLGANDGIISLASLVVGVAGATSTASTILITGVAGLLAGALSMAVGEYVSVSSQRDTERALLLKEKQELENHSESELNELIGIYEKKGLKPETAQTVAYELTEHDAFGAHVDAELGIDPNNLTNPWQAAFASALSFTLGAAVPLFAIILPPYEYRLPVTFIAVFVGLVITGILSARVSGARAVPVTLRVVIGGIIAMAVTFGIGRIIGNSFL